MNFVEEQEPEIIEGYTVISSVWIGNKRMIYAKDKTETMEMPYMKCIYHDRGIFSQYEDAMISDSFEEIMKLYADDIKAEAIIVETRNRVEDKVADACLKPDELLPAPYSMRLVGKIVAINPKHLNDGYKNIRHQLYYVTGGNGAEAGARGTTCFCVNLHTGESSAIKRVSVLGIVPEDRLPEFAKRTMEDVRRKEKEERKKGDDAR